MDYDWEKIFEDKTNKELYDIVIGKTFTPKEATIIARQELESRNFDFDNMEANKAAWQISSLIEEEDYARLEITGRRAKPISLKILLLISTGIAIIYFALKALPEYDFPLEMAAFFAGLATVFILLNNYQAKIQMQAQKRRVEKIQELKEKLDKEELLEKNSPIQKELIRHRIEESKGIRTISFIMIGIITMMLLVYILKRIL
ncbi:MAG: hypothetical protein CO098_06945 [Bacteroidetes bacterium CG_4_9_14_3_um_filter_41_19]|nr:MAG: hypothetical protein CO098_06945 [Bacteroidetes bacterium CG_4_9_14_3_um_filter_41_19]